MGDVRVAHGHSFWRGFPPLGVGSFVYSIIRSRTDVFRRGGQVRRRIRRHARARDLSLVTDLQGWIATAGPLRDITQHTGSSQRQLQRWFSDQVGMTPGAFSHLWQVRRVLNESLTRSRPDWAGLAYQFGFADQAHLVRRWKEVLGESPARFHQRWVDGGRWVDGMIFRPEPKPART
jgi:AraC-like DNA-binding protein